MTSTSNAAIDHTTDSQSEGPLKKGSQSHDDNSHTSVPNSPKKDQVKIQNENVNAQGENLAGQPTADHGGKHTGEHQGELDDFGLPIREHAQDERSAGDSDETSNDVQEDSAGPDENAQLESQKEEIGKELATPDETAKENEAIASELMKSSGDSSQRSQENQVSNPSTEMAEPHGKETSAKSLDIMHEGQKPATPGIVAQGSQREEPTVQNIDAPNESGISHEKKPAPKASEWSHQRLTEAKDSDGEESEESEAEWREMPALGEFDEYDDFGRLLARGAKREEEEKAYKGLGGAGKGYTRVQLDEDAQSATSLDEDTSYLFRENAANSAGVEGEDIRDAASQLEATKDILTESQRIAYVGVTRLSIHQMAVELQELPTTKGARKALQKGRDATMMWGQSIMARLYAHMEINSAEQIMIEQLTQHGVQPADLIPPLMQNARVKNPLAEEGSGKHRESVSSVTSPETKERQSNLSTEINRDSDSTPPPPYEVHAVDLPEIQSPSQLPTSANIDIDLRWTVLCDLFLVLLADSAYDARSRTLLERVGGALEVSPLQITRFEKRIIDALEMQEEAENQETWDEAEHMEKRQKMAKKRRYMVMGLATVGGGLVIGLSAGLLAPVIGAGLAAGFTTVGISGTSAFLGGAGGTALIASGATLTGSTIGLRASHRRTGAVRTFEYRPLHNNKRVNLVVSVSGWMTGKVDDVRLPFSTVDPIMGDLYSVLWEPEMLRSMGETINILATEVSFPPCNIQIVSGAFVNNITVGIDARSAANSRKYRFGSSNGISATTSCPHKTFIFDR